jgi:hypothetical protein
LKVKKKKDINETAYKQIEEVKKQNGSSEEVIFLSTSAYRELVEICYSVLLLLQE